MAWRYQLSFTALTGAVFCTILLGIAMTDAREYIIPDEFSLGGLALGIVASTPGGVDGIGHAVVGAVFGFALLWTVGAVGTRIFKEDAMGGGDIKLLAMIGAFLGWQSIFVTLFVGSVIGSLIGVALMLYEGADTKLAIPFGPFLAGGALVYLFFGDRILAFYLGV